VRGGESSGTGRVSPWLRRFELNHALADERGGGVRRAGRADGARAGSSECARACGREEDCGPETGARASGDGRGGGVTAGGAAIGSRDDHRFFGQFSLLKKNVGRARSENGDRWFLVDAR
jgi:hypothetical protein